MDDSYSKSFSNSDRFEDEPDSRDSVHRPLRSSVASSTTGSTTQTSGGVNKKKKKKKKKKLTRERSGAIAEEEPVVPTTVVRRTDNNCSQGDSTTASESYSYTHRSAGMSHGSSSSSNILEAYRKIRDNQNQMTHTSTPSSSTQISTDDDYIDNSPPKTKTKRKSKIRPKKIPEYNAPEFPPLVEEAPHQARPKRSNNKGDTSSTSTSTAKTSLQEAIPVPQVYATSQVLARNAALAKSSRRVIEPPVHITTELSHSDHDDNYSLSHSYQSKHSVTQKMRLVKHSIRQSIAENTTTHKHSPHHHRHNHGSDQSDSDSNSTGGGIMAFLSTFTGHPKHHMTDSERRSAQNPFLNRPSAPINKYTTVGLFGERINDETSLHHDHTRRQDLDDDSLSSYSSQSTQKSYFHLPEPMRKIQAFCGRIVTNTNFQVFMIVLIMLNALVLGIATTDFDDPKIYKALDAIDRCLLVVFTIELLLQFGYCGIHLFLDGWLVFDCLTVITSWWLEDVQVFRSFRIFRSFRLIVRLPLLKNLVLTVFHVMPRIYSILALLLLIIYVFSVLSTILYGYQKWGPPGEEVDYFGDLWLSLFTLFQMVTLENWTNVVRPIAEVHSWVPAVIYSVFVMITGFVMYNLIVAVMCDSMLVIEAQGREELRVRQKELKLFNLIAKAEEEKRMTAEMLAQYKADGRGRKRLKGLIGDDETVVKLDSKQASEWSSEQTLTQETEDDDQEEEEEEEEEEEDIEYREVWCPNCDHCHEVPKYSAGFRNRKAQRDATMAENQHRVRLLKQKIASLAETQERVTNVLQSLMYEIEASRMARLNANDSDTFHVSLGGASLSEIRSR